MTQWTGATEQTLALGGERIDTPSLASDLAQLAKLRITLLVAITTGLGYWLGLAATASDPGVIALLATLAGTSLSCIAACMLNQAIEWRSDARMRRTMDRPVAAGRVSPVAAGAMGVVTGLIGVAMLASLSGWLPALLATFTMLSYALIYTPLKKTTTLSTVVGAVPGALPPVIGYSAATGMIGAGALAMFAIMFVWQLPHFLAIAWLYREDYARGGFRMLPVVDPTGRSTFRQMLAWCLALVPVGLLPTLLNVSGSIYFVGASLLGIGFAWFGLRLIARPTDGRARAVFLASLAYLPLVLLLVVLDTK